MAIMQCSCKHEFQDSVYGSGNRVFNEKKEKGQYRCTVCNAQRTSGSKTAVHEAAKTKK